MRRRIKMVTDVCLGRGCSSTDVYIAAALAQNGPAFTIFNLTDWLLVKANRIDRDGITVDWFYWFEHSYNNKDDTSLQLQRFKSATDALKTWYIPRDVVFETIRQLSQIGD